MFIGALFDDVYFPKSERLHDRVGVAHVLLVVQNHTDVTAMHANTICECSLTPLTFKRRFQQNKCIVVIEHVRLPAQIVREGYSSIRFSWKSLRRASSLDAPFKGGEH
jgi:hypothetical protein